MAAIGSFFMLNSAQAELLTGEARLACEAVLCLSSSERPSECNPALSHYFGIKRYRKGALDWGKTVNARKAFLGLCPASSSTDTGNMPALIHAIAQGTGRCDADFLNQRLRVPKVRRECTLGDGSDRDRCPTYWGQFKLRGFFVVLSVSQLSRRLNQVLSWNAKFCMKLPDHRQG
ncbi:TrbM/KikA/MpfK family conjugal transfer protein [Paenalcaligenes faecalis]|uniref:TrbM/KikA/MpfK family conjugal transfer protein n=1 Tax=Paenalcaligenes faecalis TaxID=2980099 RepID=UPI002FD71406